MADAQDLWKQRYEFAREVQLSAEKEHRELVQQLSRALSRVSLACEGQDPGLDTELGELRAFLRLKTLSTDVLASKVDAIEQRLRSVEQRAQSGDPRLRVALDTLLDQLADSGAPREIARAVDVLRKEFRGATDPVPLLIKAIALQPDARPPQHAAPASGTSAAPRGGLLSKVFGGKAGAVPAHAPTVPEASAALIDTQPERLPDPANRALDALIETVSAPADDKTLWLLYERGKARLTRGIRWPELAPSLEDIRVLASAALARAREEFGRFLEQMNERLVDGAADIAAVGEQAAERAASADTLRTDLQAGVQGLREDIGAANDLGCLKDEVARRIDRMGAAMEAFREREERLLEKTEATASALAERVQVLQQQAAAAEAHMEVQRLLMLTDPLTQLPNREAWNRRMAEEFERWLRYDRPLSIAVCDIDRFKAVNDTHGHIAGDVVLKSVAARVRAALRDADFVARFGGEEFVVLLPETTPAQALTALEGVRKAISATPIDCGNGVRRQVTASFGIACFTEGVDAERVFQRADAALYQAKNAGRDQVAVYDGSVTK